MKKTVKTKVRKKKYCGECIFCNSKCPACGSEDVNVTFRPEYTYSNSTHNFIRMGSGVYQAALECNDCGEEADPDSPAMEKLAWAINRDINIPHVYEISITPRSNKIHVETYRVGAAVTRKRGDNERHEHKSV